jgi:hypothetical protein
LPCAKNSIIELEAIEPFFIIIVYFGICMLDDTMIKYKLINYYTKLMKFLVTTEVFETIHKEEDLKRQTELIKSQIKTIMNSGKLLTGGQFADKRGHFFVIEAANELELLELLNRNILDSCKVESHPIVSFEDLFGFFERNPV